MTTFFIVLFFTLFFIILCKLFHSGGGTFHEKCGWWHVVVLVAIYFVWNLLFDRPYCRTPHITVMLTLLSALALMMHVFFIKETKPQYF